MKNNFNKQRGFTLVELIVVMGLFSALILLASVNLRRPQTQTNLDIAALVLSADLKGQQTSAMAGKVTSTINENYGIYFEANQYTLFVGNTYSAADPNNFVVQPAGITFSTINLPSSEIVFTSTSGEVLGYSSSQNTVVLENVTGEQQTFTFNELGVFEIN